MNIKRLVLGTAAGALAVTGAQAADLPVVVEPVDYVRICDAFGVGFYYIPGTETCLRLAGRIRADYNVFVDFDDEGLDILGGGYGNDNFEDAYRFRARAYIYMDARTNTEFGLLRAYTEVQFTKDNNRSLNVNLDQAYIQFGGLTFGRAETFYAFVDTFYSAGQFFSIAIPDYKVNLIAYTFAFGNGFSASISLEEEETVRGRIVGDDGFNAPYQGTRIPNIVGNIRVDQGWGSAQVMAAGRYIEADTNVFGPTDFEEDYGFAVGAGVNINVPFGNGTELGIQANYGHGATGYASSGFFDRIDATVSPDGDLDLVDAFAVWGGLSTSFTPNVSFGIGAGYSYLDTDNLIIGVDGAGADVIGDLDYSQIDVQALLVYSPVAGLDFALGAEYRYVDQEDYTLAGGEEVGGDGDALSVFFRAQRTY